MHADIHGHILYITNSFPSSKGVVQLYLLFIHLLYCLSLFGLESVRAYSLDQSMKHCAHGQSITVLSSHKNVYLVYSIRYTIPIWQTHLMVSVDLKLFTLNNRLSVSVKKYSLFSIKNIALNPKNFVVYVVSNM